MEQDEGQFENYEHQYADGAEKPRYDDEAEWQEGDEYRYETEVELHHGGSLRYQQCV